MDYFINKYFGQSQNTPASLENIAQLEAQLGVDLPVDFVNFLLRINGFEGFIGQSYIVFAPTHTVYQMTLDYCSVFPWAVFIGSNGGLEMFVIDLRTHPNQYGLLPFIGDESDFVNLGTNFEQFLEMLSDL